MTRWLQAARQDGAPRTKPTKPTKPDERQIEFGADATGEGVPSVSSVLSERVSPAAQGRADGLEPDTGAYLDRLRIHGPATYGSMATALGWGATRAWRAEAKLRALGLVRLGDLGRADPYPTPKLTDDFGKS